MKRTALLLAAVLITVTMSACSQAGASDMQDGYYTAEAVSYDAYGWKEFITICVSDNKIITVEYNAKNQSGFLKSWDTDYMRTMNAVNGTYPNQYTRGYAAELLNKQTTGEIDAISGATHSWESFRLLADAAIVQSRAGEKSVVFVDLPASDQTE